MIGYQSVAKPDPDRDAEIVVKIVAQASLPVDAARSATKPLSDRSAGQRQRGNKISPRFEATYDCRWPR